VRESGANPALRFQLVITAFLALALLTPPLWSEDILVKTDGRETRGQIIEKVPGNFIRLKTPGGAELLFPWTQLKSINGESLAQAAIRGLSEQNWLCVFQVSSSMTLFSTEQWAMAANALPSPLESKQLNVDLFGIYWPFSSRQTFVGIVMNQSYQLNTGGTKLPKFKDVPGFGYYQERSVGISVLRALHGALDKSWFTRADFSLVQGNEAPVFKLTDSAYDSSGFGFKLGAGYILPNDGDSALVPQAVYSARWIGQNFSSRLELALGLWW